MRIKPIKRKGAVTGAAIALSARDAAALAVILSYADRADLSFEGTSAPTMHARLSAICEALDPAYAKTYAEFGGDT